MNTKRTTKKAQLPPLPRWRWLLYLGGWLVIVSVIYLKIGGEVPAHFMQVTAWRDADAFGNLAIAGVFSGLIVGIFTVFMDQIFLGIAQRKSAAWIAQNLAVSVAQTAIGVAAEGLLTAAVANAGSSNSDSASSGGVTSGGGGDFGGGGASGKF